MDIRELNSNNATTPHDISKSCLIEVSANKIGGMFISVAREHETIEDMAKHFKLQISTELPKIKSLMENVYKVPAEQIDGTLSHILSKRIANILHNNVSQEYVTSLIAPIISGKEQDTANQYEGLAKLFMTFKISNGIEEQTTPLRKFP